MKKALFALFLGSLLQGCAGYVAPLCNEHNRRDLPNFEGAFTTVLTMVDQNGSHTNRSQFTISRLAQGQYLLEQHDGSTQASLCEIGGHYYAENDKGWSTGLPSKGYIAFQVSANSDNSFDLTALGLDSKVLESRGIHYDIVHNLSTKGTPNTSDYSSILADNAKVPPEQFVQLLEPQSFKVTLRPDGSGRLAKAADHQVHGKSSKLSW